MKHKKVQKKTQSSIEFRKVTPLSKTLAFILFIGLPILAFALGMRYQSAVSQYENTDLVTLEIQRHVVVSPQVPPAMKIKYVK